MAPKGQTADLSVSTDMPLCKRSEMSFKFLLRSHQASQQTNFGRVRDLPGLPAP